MNEKASVSAADEARDNIPFPFQPPGQIRLSCSNLQPIVPRKKSKFQLFPESPLQPHATKSSPAHASTQNVCVGGPVSNPQADQSAVTHRRKSGGLGGKKRQTVRKCSEEEQKCKKGECRSSVRRSQSTSLCVTSQCLSDRIIRARHSRIARISWSMRLPRLRQPHISCTSVSANM